MPINASCTNGVYIVMEKIGIEKLIVAIIVLVILALWINYTIKRDKAKNEKERR